MERHGKHQHYGQQDNHVHMIAEGSLKKSACRLIVHMEHFLEYSHHPIGKVAVQNKGIDGINKYNGNQQQNSCQKQYFNSELQEIPVCFIFQWYIQLPIQF